MPYDPRPVSEGGNSDIDEGFSRKAPKGKFRIVGVDTFDGEDWHLKDVDTLSEAKEIVVQETKGQQMLKYYVYDDTGSCVNSAGSF